MKKEEVIGINGGMPSLSRDDVLKLVPRKEQKSFKLPPDFDSINWKSIEFLGWIHPSGHKGYILETESAVLKLWVLETDPHGSTNSSPSMCSLCYNVRSGRDIKLFQYRPNQKRLLGVNICADLKCVENVTELYANTMRETLTPKEKKARMVENLQQLILRWQSVAAKK